ncbi:UPF0057 membrane protein yqaE [Enterobacter ludwigii]|jgi:uncharacterized membrane protein YqaE (UPF0057 family)|uniref:UPF0057 membrane protein yqaE n=2 Tax=Enterobacter ludwigii TaxID=299767 RepID=G8LP22_9ENTR|nr:UPF0057 membrane protein yqaE [Enterobacter ludwigii]
MAQAVKLATLRECSLLYFQLVSLHGVVMGFWRIVFTIILPPLGVLLGKGFGWAFIINIVLTLLGYIPGLIHAFWVQSKN